MRGDGLRGIPTASASVAEGRAAPLDLIEEHLTDISLDPCRRSPIVSGRLLANWSIPADFVPSSDGSLNFVLKVQRFAAGGSECTVRALDLEKIARAMDTSGQLRGKREIPDELNQEAIEKAAARAKRKVRYLVKNMGATHLCTLTRREPAAADCWSPEDWAKAWDRLRRSLEKAIGSFPYVAILEQHEKGNYHLHIAWVGKINLNLMRPLWWGICGGRGQGNVDAQYVKVRQGLQRADRIARYISKYVTKAFEQNSRFNKKRYWSSRQTLEEARRYVLNARSFDLAFMEVQNLIGFDPLKYATGKDKRLEGMFAFPDGSGVWFNYMPSIHGADPPF